MPYLGDYLGHLLSEITIARLQADLEAVRIAELYAEHPLLRHMSVPRFRMPEVELDVPVVINELETAPADGTGGSPSITDLRKVFDDVFATKLKEERIELNAAAKTKLKQMLDRATLSLTKPPEIKLEMYLVATEFSKTAVKALSETVDPRKLVEFEEKLKATVQVEYLKVRPLPPRLSALITSAQVKEAGPGEVLTRLRIKVVEEAFEWTTIESEGETQNRLVIE